MIFFKEQNELSMNLEETFEKFQKSIKESSGFSFLSFLQMILVREHWFVCLYATES